MIHITIMEKPRRQRKAPPSWKRHNCGNQDSQSHRMVEMRSTSTHCICVVEVEGMKNLQASHGGGRPGRNGQGRPIPPRFWKPGRCLYEMPPVQPSHDCLNCAIRGIPTVNFRTWDMSCKWPKSRFEGAMTKPHVDISVHHKR